MVGPCHVKHVMTEYVSIRLRSSPGRTPLTMRPTLVNQLRVLVPVKRTIDYGA